MQPKGFISDADFEKNIGFISDADFEQKIGIADQSSTVPVGGVPVNVVNQDGFLKRAGKGLIKSEQRFGESLAGSAIGKAADFLAPGTSAAAQQQKADLQNIDLTKNILTAIKQTREKGGDTSKYLNMLRQVPGYEGASSAEQVLADKSVKQILGEAGGVLTDVLAFSSAPSSFGGAVAQGAGIGASQGFTGGLQEDKSVTESLKQGAVGGLVGGATGGLMYGLGKTLEKVGEKAYKFFIPKSTREAQLVQSYKADIPFADRIKIALVGGKEAPRTAADTAFEQGLKGTESMLGIQAKRSASSIWNDVINPALEKAPNNVNMPKFFDQLQEQIIKETPELGRQKALLEALDAMRADYSGVGEVPLSQLQKFKEGWAEFVPEKAYLGKPIAGAYNDLKDTASDLARKTLYASLGKNVKKAYIDYGNLQGIMKLGQTAMTGGRLKGGFGGFWSAIKDMALIPVSTVGGRTVYRVGQGVELLGNPGAKVVSDILDAKTLSILSEETQAKQSQAQ